MHSGDESTSATPAANFRTLLKEAEGKLSSGEWVLTKNPRGTKSAVWETFLIVTDAASGAFKDCAQCTACRHIKTYRLGQQTSSLKRHQNECRQKTDNNMGIIGAAAASTSAKEVPFDQKSSFKEACIDLCIGDIRPFNTVAGNNFKNLIQKAIDVGAKYGHIDASELVVDPTTITRGVNQRAENARAIVAPILVQAIREGRCAATTDMWTDDYRKNHYLTVTLHFVDENWKLKNLILFTSVFPYESATGANIYAEIVAQFAKLNLSEEDVSKNLVWITDGGANMIKALENCNRLPCTAHAINTVLKHTFAVKLVETDFVGEKGNELINAVDDLASFLKDSKIDRELSSVPKPFASKANNKRYKSRVPMLESLNKNYLEISDILEKHGESSRLELIQITDLAELIEFLKLIEAKAGADNRLTGASFQYLNEISAENENDSPFMSEVRMHFQAQLGVLDSLNQIESCKSLVAYLKRSGLSSRLTKTVKQDVETRWNSTVTMLRSVNNQFDQTRELLRTNGELNRMLGIDREKINDLIEFLDSFERETDRLQGENEPTLPFVLLSYNSLLRHCSPKSTDGLMIASLRERARALLHGKIQIRDEHKLAIFLRPEFRLLRMLSTEERNQVYQLAKDSCEKVQLPETAPLPEPKRRKVADDFDTWRDDPGMVDEIALYVAEGSSRDQLDHIGFWKSKIEQYPKLSRIAQKVLCIPATSAPSERVFSAAGITISARRSSLSPRNVNDALFLYSYLKFAGSSKA